MSRHLDNKFLCQPTFNKNLSTNQTDKTKISSKLPSFSMQIVHQTETKAPIKKKKHSKTQHLLKQHNPACHFFRNPTKHKTNNPKPPQRLHLQLPPPSPTTQHPKKKGTEKSPRRRRKTRETKIRLWSNTSEKEKEKDQIFGKGRRWCYSCHLKPYILAFQLISYYDGLPAN